MGKHMIPFATMEDEERALIDLAFSKKKADDRKEWLRQFKVWQLAFKPTKHLLNLLFLAARNVSRSQH